MSNPLEDRRPMGAYPCTLTADGFILHGQEYRHKPSIGSRGSAGMRAHAIPFKEGGTGRQWVLVPGAAGNRKRILNPYEFRTGQVGAWPQAEGNPMLNRGPRGTCNPPDWDSNDTVMLVELPRYFYLDEEAEESEPGLKYDALPGNFVADYISHEGIVLGSNTVAALVSLFNQDASAIVAYLVREWNLETEEVTDWIHVLDSTRGSLGTNNNQRRQGFLFYDQAADVYTVACSDGLLMCTRANAPTPTCCAWEHEYGDIPPESAVSVTSQYALQGAFDQYRASASAPFNDPDNCAVSCYKRNETEWEHVATVSLPSLLPDFDFVRSCGKWDPYFDGGGTPENSENTRWAYLPATAEWVLWIVATLGDTTRPTDALAGLVFIKANSGAARINPIGTANSLLVHRSGLQTELEARLTYQSSHHPTNWTGLTGGTPVDTGGVNGWSTGHVYTSSEMASLNASGILDDYQPPDEDHVIWGTIAQQVKRFTGWTTEFDPTVAKEAARLDPGFSDFIPRGIVSGDKIYLAIRNSNWVTSGDYTTGPADPPHELKGNYEDFTMGSHDVDGETYTDKLRVYSIEQDVSGGFAFPAENTLDRLFILMANSASLLDAQGLTREFTVADGGFDFYYWQRPIVHEMAVAGDYVWVLASDWWAVDNQKLSMILLDKTTLTELDRIDLSPDEDLERLWNQDLGRAQLVVGVDGLGDPWANVIACWNGPDEWLAQEIRYESGSLTKTTVHASDLGSPIGSNVDIFRPEVMTEAVNLALSSGQQFWIDRGQYIAQKVDS